MLFLVYFIVIFVRNSSSLNATIEPKELKCLNNYNSNVDDGGHQYCNCTYQEFIKNYDTSNLKLTNLMEKLKAWNCSQFKEECENRYFDFNRFTFLVYENFCNSSNFLKICKKELEFFQKNISNSTFPRLSMY